MTPLVVDASVGMKWLVFEENREHALRLLNGRYRLYVPDLFFAEIANILWRHVRHGLLGPVDASDLLRVLDDLDLAVSSIRSLSSQALDIACQTGRTAYDSLYIALAVQERIPVITADRRLYNALSAGPFASLLLWIEEIQPPSEH